MTTQYPDPQYAIWTDPETAFPVIYSLPVFREIEMVCDDGFRKIPHGGLEVGGLLLGQVEGSSIYVDGFRSVECEHARGPSFVLSEKDLGRLREQLASLDTDPEIQGLRPVGWFISHARNKLQMHEREVALFDELFPAKGSVTVLVRPERSSPSRFSFFGRSHDGSINPDGTLKAVVLPTVVEGLTADRLNPTASIPASQLMSPLAPLPLPSEPSRKTEILAAAEAAFIGEPGIESERGVKVYYAAEPQPFAVSDLNKEEAAPRPAEAASLTVEAEVKSQEPINPEVLSPAPGREKKFKPKKYTPPAPERANVSSVEAPPPEAPTKPTAKQPLPKEPALDPLDSLLAHQTLKSQIRTSRVRIAAILALAALLGCGVGYWAYAQLPSATIPLRVEAEPPNLVIVWPASQTSGSEYAALRVDNGQPVPLSDADKAAGRTQLNIKSDNVKVELIAQHWMRDSHGIVRFINGAGAAPAPPPLSTPPPTLPGLTPRHRR